jgi:LacI family transcriptional regulator
LGRAKVTIADVAKLAGVSLGTASNVLSGKVRVRKQTEAKVAEAMRALGYVPNVHAQVLRQSASMIIGLCFPHRSSAFMNDLAETMEQIGTDAGYSIMHVFSRQEPETELRRIKDLLRLQIDGLILHPSTTPQATLDFLFNAAAPVVLIDSSNEDARFDRVVLDNFTTMQRAAERLVGLGHRRIVFVCRRDDIAVTQHRLNGLIAARKAMPEMSFEHVAYRGDEAYLAQALREAFERPDRPTAIIAGNSDQAALVIGILGELPVRYPEEVSLLAFDEPDWSNLVSPSLSVIRQPTDRIASEAWSLLTSRMAGADGEPRKVVLGATIELRDSIRAAPLAPAPKSRRAVAADRGRASAARLRT